MNDKNLIYIKHILENIKDIDIFIKNISKNELDKNKEKLNAIIRSIEVIGEAAKNLPTSFREQHKEIPWKRIIGTRDILIHHYFGIDTDILWNIIKKDLPDLEGKMQKIKKELSN